MCVPLCAVLVCALPRICFAIDASLICACLPLVRTLGKFYSDSSKKRQVAEKIFIRPLPLCIFVRLLTQIMMHPLLKTKQGGVAAPPRAMKASNSGGNLAASDLHDIREHDEPSYTLPSEYTFSTTASSSPRAPRSRAPTASGGPPSVAATPRKRGTTVNALDLATALETIDTYTRQTGGGYDGSRTLPRMPRTSQGGGAGGGGGAADLVSLFQPMGPEQPASQQGVQGGRSRAASQGPALANPASKKLKQPFIPI